MSIFTSIDYHYLIESGPDLDLVSLLKTNPQPLNFQQILLES